MARTFGPSVLPKDMNRWVYEAIRRLEQGHSASQTTISAILRGEDDGGNPLVDTTDFFKLSGRSHDQDAHGSTRSAGALTLSSTVHATKGLIYLGDAHLSAYDETNNLLGLGLVAPTARLHLHSDTGTTESIAVPITGGGNNIDWGPVGAVSFTIALSDSDNSTYAQWTPGTGFASTLGGNLTAGQTNLGGTITIKITARCNHSQTNSRMDCSFSNQSGGGNFKDIFLAGPNDAGGHTVDAVLTPSFVVYSFPLSAPEIAAMNFGSQPFQWQMAFSGIPTGSGTYDISRIEIVFDSLVSVTQTLQKWDFSSYLDQLDFVSDGASAYDLVLSGNAPLRTSAGDGTSGLRFVTSSSTSRIEVGTAAAAAMTLILSGTRSAIATSIRAATSGLMISDIVAGSITAPSALLHLVSVASNSTILLKVQRKSGQTGDLTEWLDSDGTTKLAFVDKDGKFTMPTVTLVTGAAANYVWTSTGTSGAGIWSAISPAMLPADIAYTDVANVFTRGQTITLGPNEVALQFNIPGVNTQHVIHITNSTSGNDVAWVDIAGQVVGTSFAILAPVSSEKLTITNNAAITTSKTYKVDNTVATNALFVMSEGTQTVNGTKAFTGANTHGGAEVFNGATKFRSDGTSSFVHFVDQSDLTKILGLNLSGIATATTRAWTIGNYSGYPAVPANEGTSGYLLVSSGAGAQPVWTVGTGLTLTVKDSLFTIVDDGDTSKAIQFQVSGVSPSTTRILTVQNASGTLPLLEFANNFTKKQTITPDTDTAALRIVTITSAVGTASEVYNTDTAGLVSYIDSQGGNVASTFQLMDVPVAQGNNAVIIQAKSAISTGRIYKFDNSIASTDILLAGGTQTVSGAKTFTGASVLRVDGTSSRVVFADQTTTTKLLALALSGLTAATTRKWTALDFSGYNVIVGDTATASLAAGLLGKVDLTGQTANITTTNLTSTPAAGLYVVEVILMCTTAAGTAGTLTVTIGATDNVGAFTKTPITAFSLATTGRTEGRQIVRVSSGDITYAVAVTGIYSTAQYAIYVRVLPYA